ncbi:glycoside hydrolase family 3 N-terminal domain-containing protein [Nocardia alni]|uniref:glycoside hydrolase family 3 N-terminal domain-containing protein n=1 Tax=Nocardia alni TaxID=2815723 RepID=UPI001C21B189|nr:glycoside hydrolase family 3 N-terminal domain-containing protein [Nocardia alni]
MRMVPGIVLAVMALGLTACSSGSTTSTSTSSDAATSARVSRPATPTKTQLDCNAGYLAQFTTRQKLAQLLTVGVTGTQDALNLVRTEQVGGIFIGSWTEPALLADKQIDQVKAAARVPLMVTIDEEGGRGSRLADLIGEAPSARVTAQTQTVDEFYQKSLARGRAMKDLGITVDFAPDTDVSNEPDDGVIGDRSFSNDPNVVTQYAGTFIRAMHDAGVGTVMKHFPGHGHGSGDSHTGAVQTPPLAQLQNDDLVPFRGLIGSGAAVMVGHLDVPGLTNGVPASLSPQAMSLLRKGVGYNAAPYNGPIFTDDLSGMAAITQRMGIEDAVATALEAGADSALWISSGAVSAVLDRLVQQVQSGKLPMAQVDASVLRMAAFKGIHPSC